MKVILLELKKVFPTGILWENQHVKASLEIKILEGKNKYSNTAAQVKVQVKDSVCAVKDFPLPKKCHQVALHLKKKKTKQTKPKKLLK